MARVLREGDVLCSARSPRRPIPGSVLAHRAAPQLLRFPNDEARQAFDRVANERRPGLRRRGVGPPSSTARRFGSDPPRASRGAPRGVLNPTRRQARFRACGAAGPGDREHCRTAVLLPNASAALNEPAGDTVLAQRADRPTTGAGTPADALEDRRAGELVRRRLGPAHRRPSRTSTGSRDSCAEFQPAESRGRGFAPGSASNLARNEYEQALRDIEFLGRREADGTFPPDAGRISDELGHSAFAQRGPEPGPPRQVVWGHRRGPRQQATTPSSRTSSGRSTRGTRSPRWELVGSRRTRVARRPRGAGVRAAIRNKASNLHGGGFVSGGVIIGPVGPRSAQRSASGIAMVRRPRHRAHLFPPDARQGRGDGSPQASQRLRTALERPRVPTGSRRARRASAAGRCPRSCSRSGTRASGRKSTTRSSTGSGSTRATRSFLPSSASRP